MVSFQQQLRCVKAIPHNSKCRHGERGAADAKPKAQIILDAAKVSAASGGNSEPKQGQRSQSARGFCPRSTMRVPQPDIIEHFGNADAVPQPPERCLSRKAGIVRCCLCFVIKNTADVPDDVGASAVLVFAVKQKVMRVMRDDASIVPYKSGFVCCGFVMRSAAKFLCSGVRAPRPTGCFLCP